ncbi:MAG: ATP-dependent DNA helicase [Nitrospiraceae bacterium]|nr:MAG: ATP-dependent DNA helicase [Nitrospiraceae bacterium]
MSIRKESIHHISVSVRELVEFSYRSGDLDLTTFSKEYTLDPLLIHQWIQRTRAAEYESEVPVSKCVSEDDLSLEISGRMDGVYTCPDRTIIDEIKTTVDDPEKAASSRIPLHWAQAKCYAYMYADEHNLDEITVQLTYCNIETRTRKETQEVCTFLYLESFFNNIVSQYIARARVLINWKVARNVSSQKMSFPFPDYRPGQQTMTDEVFAAIKNNGQLLVQAPTGIGKTMAALFPAVKALGKERTEKVFFLTARSTGRLAAEKALAAMRDRGLRLKALSLTAKDKICAFPESMCSPAECAYARGHYDRIPSALEVAFQQDALTEDIITELSHTHEVCPFEFSLDLSLLVDCIICDYNYIFDPRVHLRRYFDDVKRRYAFIIDEAHNLVDRARDMFSAEIDKQAILDLRRMIKNRLPDMYKILGRINTKLLAMRKECELRQGAFYDRDLPPDLDALLLKFTFSARRWLAENRKTAFRQKMVELYSTINHFLTILDLYDSRYITSYKTEAKDLKIKLYCIDPSSDMHAALSRGSSAVFLSATLEPMDYFIKILGLDRQAQRLILSSPFPKENLEVIIASRISTLYRDREFTKTKVAEMLASLAQSKPGNYIFYFPSYVYLNLVFNVFTEIAPAIPAIIQKPDFSERERHHFLNHFKAGNERTLAGFAVLGGVFAEGIDLTGDRLTGAAIVGVGLPGISPERNCIRQYFDETENMGYAFAYQFPGVHKVLQAAGRVIRTEHDMGVVLLIDRRFASYGYRNLMPDHWKAHYIQSPAQLTDRLNQFWWKNFIPTVSTV